MPCNRSGILPLSGLISSKKLFTFFGTVNLRKGQEEVMQVMPVMQV